LSYPFNIPTKQELFDIDRRDVLYLKSGEYFKGNYVGKVDEQIVFLYLNQYLIPTTKKFPINNVETIVTKNGELTYPFDIPTKQEYPKFSYQALPVISKIVLLNSACFAACYISLYLIYIIIKKYEPGM